MPKATILCGSANPEGVTISMCREAEGCLESAGYDVDLIILSELEINHCTDCGACRDGGCIMDDGMAVVYDSFSTSDLLILASPIHFSGPSSLIKTAMDRFQLYWYNRDLPHPRYCAAMLCGGSEEPRFQFTVSIFRAFSITTGMEWLGHAEIPFTDERHDSEVHERIPAFIDGLIGT